MNKAPIAVGEVFEVPYPFVRDTYHGIEQDEEGEGWHEVALPSWKPGTRSEYTGAPDGDTGSVADAMGAQILTVISLHRPGKYPERVFFTRQWRDPDGKVWGKTKLRITTRGAFSALCAGYRHSFDLKSETA